MPQTRNKNPTNKEVKEEEEKEKKKKESSRTSSSKPRGDGRYMGSGLCQSKSKARNLNNFSTDD